MADKNPFDDPKFGPESSNPFDDPDFGKPSSGARRYLADPALSLAKGVVEVPEALVGLADIPTGGAIGKGLEGLGVDFKRTKGILDEYLTPEQQAANARVQSAEGILPTIAAAFQNPSTILHSAIESAPSMIGAGAIGRGLIARLGERMSPVAAGAIGEGAISAGQTAEQVREDTGTLNPQQAAIAAGSGALTGAITAGSGRLARGMGISDIDTMLAGGAAQGANKGLARRVGEGVLTEGLLEEFPQSAQEQIAQNLAEGKPWDDGVANAAVMGGLVGGLMGGGANVLHGQPPAANAPATAEQPPQVPEAPRLALPPPQPLPMGQAPEGGGDAGPSAAEERANAIYAARDAEELRREGAMPVDRGPTYPVDELGVENIEAAPPPQPIEALPAPGQVAPDLGSENGPLALARQHAAENAQAHAAAVYAAREAEEQRQRELVAKNPLTAAAHVATLSGATANAQANRQAQIDLGTFDRSKEQAKADAKPGEEPKPVTPPPATMPISGAVFPFANPEAAQKRAELMTAQTGVEHQAAPHPTKHDAFAVQAIKPLADEAQTSPEIGSTVKESGNAAQQASAEAPRAVGGAEARQGDQVDGQGPASGGAAARGGEQAQGQVAPAASYVIVDKTTGKGVLETFNQRVREPGFINAARYEVVPIGDYLGRVNREAKASLIDEQAHAAAPSPQNERPEPSQAQIEAGNYAKGHIKVHGLDISVENPEGSVRRSKPGAAEPWETTMSAHYGYIRGTIGKDKDHVDAFVKPGTAEGHDGPAFVIDQPNAKGDLDEHKVMLGYASGAEAIAAYKAHYPADHKLGAVSQTTPDELKQWLKSGNMKRSFSGTGIGRAEVGSDPMETLGPAIHNAISEQPEGIKPAPTQTLARDGPWDFESTWPAPQDDRLRDAGRSGLFDELPEDATEERRTELVAETLTETANDALDQLHTIAALQEAMKTGIPPGGRKKLEGEKLAQMRKNALRDIKAARDLYQGFVGSVEDHFGHEAAQAWSRHLGTTFAEQQPEFEKPPTPEEAERMRQAEERDAEKMARTSKPKKPKAPKKETPFAEAARKRFLKAIITGGGIELGEVKDITGENAFNANKLAPGLFKRNGRTLDKVVEQLHAAGYLTDEDVSTVDGAVDIVRDKVREALDGKAVFRMADVDDAARTTLAEHMAEQHDMDASVALEALDALPSDFTTDEAVAAFDAAAYLREQGIPDDEREAILERAAVAAGDEGDYESAVRDESAAYRARGENRQQGAREAPALELTSETNDEVLAAEQAAKDAAAAAVQQDERDRQERIRREVRDRSQAASESFQLGQSAEANLMGQSGLFEAPAHETPKPRAGDNLAPATLATEAPQAAPDNDRDHFTVERLNNATGQMEPITFQRGEHVKISGLDGVEEITGVSHANREFRVGHGERWFHFGAAYKTEQPTAATKPTVPMSSVVESVNAKHGAELGEADRLYTLADHPAIAKRIREGDITAAELRMQADRLIKSKDAIVAELSRKTLKELAPNGTGGQKKDSIVKSIYENLLGRFIPGTSFTWSPFTETHEQAIKRHLAAVTDEQIQAAAAERREKLDAQRKALENPETLSEFITFVSARGEAALTSEQRAKYDDLRAEQTRGIRDRQQERKATVQAVGTTVGADIIETKHTQKGHDLFVVQLEQRVEKDAYTALNTAAKKLGGYYSSFKGNGAVPGFQFKTREAAEAFKALATEGNTAAATEVAQERREERLGVRESAAVTKLREMADSMSAKAEEELGRDRQTNTARRASMASGIEERARGELQIAETMRNIASAIEAGEAKHLLGLRTKVQLEQLTNTLTSAMQQQANASGMSYADIQRNGLPAPTIATAEHVKFPELTLHREDAIRLGHAFQKIDGLKLVGARLLKTAETVSKDKDRWVIGADVAEKAIAGVETYNTKVGTAGRISELEYLDNTRKRIERLRTMGIEDEPSLRAAIRELIEVRATKREADKAKQLERNLIGSKVGVDFFPTPTEVAQRMVSEAGIEPGMKVLEPSAGNGNIAEAIRAVGAQPDVVELSSSLREVLQAKGHNLVGQDFMDVPVRPQYDRIIMNPPFSNSQDIEHVQRAYAHLKPGGRLVAIMGEGAFFREDAKARGFRDWLSRVGGTEEQLPAGTFKDKSLMATTGANARLVVIDKATADAGPDVMFDPGDPPAGWGSIEGDVPPLGERSSILTDAPSQADAETLRASIQRTVNARFPDRKTTIPPGSYIAVRLPHDADLQGVAGAFGKRIVGIRVAPGFNEPIRFGGVANVQRDVIYIREDASRPHLSVLGHELAHELRRDAPALYADLVAAIQPHINQSVYRALWLPRAKGAWAGLSSDKMHEEFIGDVLGDGFMHASFWNALADRNPSLGARIWSNLKSMIDKVRSVFTGGTYPWRVREYLSDFDKAMRTAGEVLALYPELRGLAVNGDAQFHGQAVPSPQPFYSQLARAVSDAAPFAKDGTIQPGQLKLWLASRIKDGAVKKDEVEWTGINEWLDSIASAGGKSALRDIVDDGRLLSPAERKRIAENPGLVSARVSRDQVNAFLASNGVQVQDVVKGEPDQSEDIATIEAAGYRVEESDVPDIPILAHADGSFVEGYSSVPGPVMAAFERVRSPPPAETKFATYQLPGGENYRELLLTLPVTRVDGDLSDSFDERRDPNFRSSHFDEPNVLAHVRFNERTDADGKKVLFLEELQSDWAQKGRREGFKATAEEEAAIKAEYEAAAEAARAARAGGSDAELQAAEQRLNAASDAWNARINDANTPAAPFVQDTKAWVALSLKRMIRWAAENGFDRVAWTTGAQQAERYDLSKHIERVEATRTPDAMFHVLAYVHGRGTPAFAGVYGAKDLPGVVGKDLAEKIVAETPPIGLGGRAWKGLDLKVGGEGMRAFYDRIVPQVANDLLKKLGGGRVGSVPIARSNNLKDWRVENARGRDGYIIRAHIDGTSTMALWGGDAEVGHPSEAKLYGTQGEAQAVATQLSSVGMQQPGFDITPAMADSALAGLPMFDQDRDGIIGRAQQEILDTFTSARQFNWWHRTVGTQFHKAQVNAHFRPVFQSAQRYLQDVSQLAMEAADQATALLPRLRTVREAFSMKELTPTYRADVKRVSDLVFQSTLNDTAPTAAQLAQLTPEQRTMYDQTRAAIDLSLDQVLASELTRLTKGERLNPATLKLAKDHPQQALDILASELVAQAAEAATPEESARKLALAEQMQAEAAKVAELKAAAYAPLMRFGRYTVDVVQTTDGKPERVYFGMFETQREANRMYRDMQEQYPEGNVIRGTLDEDSWQLFQGLSLDSLGAFARATGMSDKVFAQDWYKLAVSSRSALKRLIHRKGIAGFNEDLPRVLASFITSNARLASRNYHFGEMVEATQAIPKYMGDVRSEAAKLVKYVQNPQEEAHALRGFLFVNFLGGSVASALTNMTQPVLMTLPYLSQFGGTARAARALASAAGIATGSPIADPALREAMAKAGREGITEPQELHQLYAESIRGLGSSLPVRKGLRVWGSMFALAESFNRKITFAAAYQMAQDPGALEAANAARVARGLPAFADAFAFAENAVEDTQGIYNRGNRPDWARGAIGATVFTFKQFSISYLEFMKRLPPKEKALAGALLILAAGLQGAPGAEDLEDLIDTIGQMLGYNTNSKEALRQAAVHALGEQFGGLATHGLSGIPGAPVDVSARLGLGNLVPASGIFKRSETDTGQDVSEVLGPVGGLIQQAHAGVSAAEAGQFDQFLVTAMPSALQSFFRGLDMWQSGQARDIKGRKIIDVDKQDAAFKMLGLQPQDVAFASQKSRDVRQDLSMVKTVELGIVDRWARGILDRDQRMAGKAMADLAQWNRQNPAYPIAITRQQIMQRVQQAMLERSLRTAKTAPKEVRARVLEDLR